MRLGLKVDVDTLGGLKEGVPALLDILGERGLTASFFLALGPDNSGRAIFRVFTQEGFLEKMLRTRAPSVYGLTTMLYGTLLPAPVIAAAAPAIVPAIVAAGHEVGMHGFDHVRWHDRLVKMSYEEIAGQVRAAQEVFLATLSHPAVSFAAPGWQATKASRDVLADQGFLYASDTRGEGPYWPRFGNTVTPLLEIPTTLPTLDELLGFQGCDAQDYYRLIAKRLSPARPQVLTLHAELEGGPFRVSFASFLDEALGRGVTFFRLIDWAGELTGNLEALPACPISLRRLPGRAGRVACQVTGAT